jgi:hypothetical protein
VSAEGGAGFGVASRKGTVREAVNDRVLELTAGHGSYATFLCECADEGCPAFITLTLHAFEGVRRTGRPVLAPGHVPLVSGS